MSKRQSVPPGGQTPELPVGANDSGESVDAGGGVPAAGRSGLSWGAEWLPLLIGAAFALAAFLPILFDVIREIPPSYGCGEEEPPGLDQMVASYRQGFEVLHGLAALLLVAAIAALSTARRRRKGVTTGVAATVWAVAVIGAVALAALIGSDTAAAWPAVLPAIALVGVAQALGTQVTALIFAAAIVLLGARAILASRTSSTLYEASTVCWLLLMLTIGHAMVVSGQGHGPWLC